MLSALVRGVIWLLLLVVACLVLCVGVLEARTRWLYGSHISGLSPSERWARYYSKQALPFFVFRSKTDALNVDEEAPLERMRRIRAAAQPLAEEIDLRARSGLLHDYFRFEVDANFCVTNQRAAVPEVELVVIWVHSTWCGFFPEHPALNKLVSSHARGANTAIVRGALLDLPSSVLVGMRFPSEALCSLNFGQEDDIFIMHQYVQHVMALFPRSKIVIYGECLGALKVHRWYQRDDQLKARVAALFYESPIFDMQQDMLGPAVPPSLLSFSSAFFELLLPNLSIAADSQLAALTLEKHVYGKPVPAVLVIAPRVDRHCARMDQFCAWYGNSGHVLEHQRVPDTKHGTAHLGCLPEIRRFLSALIAQNL